MNTDERRPMRPLPVIAGDLMALAEMMRDQASQIEEVVRFFGGGAPPAQQPSAPVIRTHTAPSPPPEGEPPPRRRSYQKTMPESRKLSKEEKAGIRADWASLDPRLRTATNRRALAAKYQISGQQMFALIRDDMHQQRISQIARRPKQQQPSSPGISPSPPPGS